MKRICSVLCAICIFISTCSGYTTIEKDIKKEKIISFNFTGKKDEMLEYIDISEYENVEIVDYSMNKGKSIITLEEDNILLDLYDGKYSKGEEIREKVTTEYIEDAILPNGKYVFEPSEEASKVINVDGDFKNAIAKNGQIILEVDENAKGIAGYDLDNVVTSEISIEVPEDNMNRTVYSEYYQLEKMPDNAKVVLKEVEMGANADIDLEDGQIRLLFDDGVPQIEETIRKDTHSYFWIDRAIDGTFRQKYPNSIYRTDRYYFEGRGNFVDDERLIMDIGFEDEWKDYVGFVLDNQKYIYPLSDNFPEELFKNCIILDKNSISFDRNYLNTEELTIEITDNSVRYIPKGILYSMGELVAYSEDWGETVPNNPDESEESFYNNISERMETYVKHFKFFYGPKVKETLGGNFKYPYKAKVLYEHYKPEKMYSGSVTYKYSKKEKVEGYLFDGWVKISYTQREEVNDYPPTAPYNVFYNNLYKKLEWVAGSDDYTPSEKLIYEIEIYIDEEFDKISETQGLTSLTYENGKDCEFRVRAVDELGQASEWAYSNDSNIEIIGDISPAIVSPGEKVNISAIVKSLNEVEDVYAVSNELNINEKLIKNSENRPNAKEISFNLLNYTGKEPWLIVDDISYAQVDSSGDISIKNYFSDAETEQSIINVELPSNITFTDNGTIILPNQNYTDIPIDITSFNDKLWYFYSMCNLKFINKNTNKEESFIQFVNDTSASLVGRKEKIEVTPYIKVNLFEYVDGTPTYEKVPVIVDIAGNPISIVWSSKDDITEFTIYAGETYLYTYEVQTTKIKENIKNFSTYALGKSMDRMLKNSVGYQYHYKSKYYNWVNMYKAASVLDMPFLGYKLKNKNNSDIYDDYNNSSIVRDVNRIVFLDEPLSLNAIEVYLSKIKSTNLLIQRKKYETVFAKDIQEINYKFSKGNISIPNDAICGEYEIDIFAMDKVGNSAKTTVKLLIEDKDTILDKEDVHIGRFRYVDNNINKKVVEELSLTKQNLDTEGFISAGETLAIVFDKEMDIDNIIIDIEGDNSIKQYDSLTEMFLEKNPSKYGLVGDIGENYKFPVILYPIDECVFLYTIPYGTKQSLESWYTLREKTDDYEDIDVNLLFNRILPAYKLNVYINGDKNNAISFDFDVFERWDTILNRDASKYIINSDSRWRIEL